MRGPRSTGRTTSRSSQASPGPMSSGYTRHAPRRYYCVLTVSSNLASLKLPSHDLGGHAEPSAIHRHSCSTPGREHLRTDVCRYQVVESRLRRTEASALPVSRLEHWKLGVLRCTKFDDSNEPCHTSRPSILDNSQRLYSEVLRLPSSSFSIVDPDPACFLEHWCCHRNRRASESGLGCAPPSA